MPALTRCTAASNRWLASRLRPLRALPLHRGAVELSLAHIPVLAAACHGRVRAFRVAEVAIRAARLPVRLHALGLRHRWRGEVKKCSLAASKAARGSAGPGAPSAASRWCCDSGAGFLCQLSILAVYPGGNMPALTAAPEGGGGRCSGSGSGSGRVLLKPSLACAPVCPIPSRHDQVSGKPHIGI